MYKNESLFPLVTTSRVYRWADVAHSFFLCSLKSKGEAHGEKNSKNCLENCEKSLKHLSPAAAAQWIK
jgi:hypothetical protein